MMGPVPHNPVVQLFDSQAVPEVQDIRKTLCRPITEDDVVNARKHPVYRTKWCDDRVSMGVNYAMRHARRALVERRPLKAADLAGAGGVLGVACFGVFFSCLGGGVLIYLGESHDEKAQKAEGYPRSRMGILEDRMVRDVRALADKLVGYHYMGLPLSPGAGAQLAALVGAVRGLSPGRLRHSSLVWEALRHARHGLVEGEEKNARERHMAGVRGPIRQDVPG